MGVDFKVRKKTNLKKIYRKKTILDSIPDDLVIDIVARAAAYSSKDLFNFRLSCKTLNKLGDDNYIIQRVSLDKFPACNLMDENWYQKFVVIIAQKNHHTKFFLPASRDIVSPGTVIDNRICHPRNNDFYLCAQAGIIGTTRPTHYHFLQMIYKNLFILFLSRYQRSTTAISVVAPIYYAHLAATQMRQTMFDVTVPQLPHLKENVCNKMFFVYDWKTLKLLIVVFIYYQSSSLVSVGKS
ncbi:hypothetical protein POM88_011506 [Heracleum sosnowskyi]|uniref:Piwi domain-containing protein n=1 Tax=Heracleum sosnowskyi TaxID=360622 RepID=A0AAD8IV14_9APIA|nr:hypothetical protein POM88_011506 [Heracleum sosnowskyi]